MSFAELIGHAKPLATLRSALAHDRLHHAYLFVGPEGVGKRTVAMALARAVHCSEAANDYCSHCANCASIIDGNHADVRMVQPLSGKKEISIQQVRDIERELRYRSFGGRRKIAVIDPAGLMNPSAQNALLKTLEEPPENSLIIAITSNAGGLLPTLRSRCLRLSFAPLPRAELATFLQATHGVKPDAAEFLAAMSMGCIGAAVHLDQQALMEKRRSWAGMLSALTTRDYQSAIATAENLSVSREETLEFLKWAQSWYRDLLIHSISQRRDELVNLDMLLEIEEQSARSGVGRALTALSQIGSASAGIQRNLNRRMVLEELLFSVIEGD